jgi:ceramide glucosyltransferase
MIPAWVAWSVLGAACLPLMYYATVIAIAVRFLERRVSQPSSASLPPISVLKPVRGIDPGAYEHFATFCRQDYADYEILFGVADPNDGAIAIVHRLIGEFPDRSIRLVSGIPDLGPNSKVSTLCRLVREARHNMLVISDSDVSVPSGYLRAVATAFDEGNVGVVTCLYRGVPDGRHLWPDLEALGISCDFMAGVLVAERVEGVRFALGATMATTRAHLSEIGGFETLVDRCADDFELGSRVAARGYRVELADCVVRTACVAGTFAALFRHELRWAITQRQCRPVGYLARTVVTQGLPWAIAAVAVAPSSVVALIYSAAYVVLRTTMAWVVGVRILRDDTVPRRWWLLPVRDAMSFLTACAAHVHDRIEWRGREFHLTRGQMLPIVASDVGRGRTAIPVSRQDASD